MKNDSLKVREYSRTLFLPEAPEKHLELRWRLTERFLVQPSIKSPPSMPKHWPVI